MESVTKTYSVRLRNRGQMTIPQSVRDELSVRDGDILSLIQMDDFILITPSQSRVSALTEQFTAEMEKAGVSLADLLEGLAEEREAIHQERQSQDA